MHRRAEAGTGSRGTFIPSWLQSYRGIHFVGLPSLQCLWPQRKLSHKAQLPRLGRSVPSLDFGLILPGVPSLGAWNPRLTEEAAGLACRLDVSALVTDGYGSWLGLRSSPCIRLSV